MVNPYWFKPKIFGYGATPITWEGWALTLGYCGVIALATLAAIMLIEARGLSNGAVLWTLWGVWVLVLAAATAVLVVVSKRRTDGEWRWRWGRRAGSGFRERSKV